MPDADTKDGAAQRSDLEWIAALPKVELHVHLEGAMPRSALQALIRKYGGGREAIDDRALQRRFAFTSFQQFIDAWVWKNGFLREYEDFAFIAEQTARELVAQRVVYAEMFVSPVDFARRGLRCQRIIEAVRSGLSKVPEVPVAIVVDLVRDFGPARAERTLQELAEARELGVIGVGLGGSEHFYPAAPFAAVFREARELGLHTTAHAGEAAGSESVWSALRSLEVERIGHGTRAHEDPSLLVELVERSIPLEMCPISNVRTGVVPRLAAHPIKRYLEAGLCVTVGTDDPLMFGNRLDNEYALLMREVGMSRGQVAELLRNGVRAAWVDEVTRQALLERLEGGLAKTPMS